MAAAREAALALRARLASGLAAGPAGHVREFTASAALGRFRRGPDHTVRYEDAPVGAPKPDLVEKFLGEELLSGKDRLRVEMRNAAAPFERFEGDTGSSEVQVVRVTQKILALAEHMRSNRKDFSARRGLEAMLSRRRALLQYMRRHDFDMYAVTLARLNLKDNFAKQARLVRHPTAKGAP